MITRTYTHLDLGTTLLESAIELYVAGEFLAAIVLAGAAEDQLGGPFAKSRDEWRNDPRAHKQDARAFGAVYQHLFGEEHNAPWDPVNEVKNRVKHYSTEPLVFDAEDEAYWAIDRSMSNYALCTGNDHPRSHELAALHRKYFVDGPISK